MRACNAGFSNFKEHVTRASLMYYKLCKMGRFLVYILHTFKGQVAKFKFVSKLQNTKNFLAMFFLQILRHILPRIIKCPFQCSPIVEKLFQNPVFRS